MKKKLYLCNKIKKIKIMPTMIVNIENSADIRNIAATVRQLKGVAEVKVQKEAEFEPIPGMPYTHEEYMADIRKAEEDYAMGRMITSEKLKEKMATW